MTAFKTLFGLGQFGLNRNVRNAFEPGTSISNGFSPGRLFNNALLGIDPLSAASDTGLLGDVLRQISESLGLRQTKNPAIIQRIDLARKLALTGREVGVDALDPFGSPFRFRLFPSNNGFPVLGQAPSDAELAFAAARSGQDPTELDLDAIRRGEGNLDVLVQALGERPGGAGNRLLPAISLDVQRQQEAANTQFERNQEQIESFESALTGGVDRFLEGAEEAASSLSELGQEQLGDVEARLDEAIEGFQDLTSQQISQVTGNLQRNLQRNLRALNAGFDPQTGQKLKPGEAFQLRAQLQDQVDRQTSQITSQLLSRFNETRAQLRLAAAGQLAQAQQGQAALAQAAASLRSSALAQALQFELQGRAQLAELVRANPESVVSLFSALSAFEAAKRA